MKLSKRLLPCKRKLNIAPMESVSFFDLDHTLLRVNSSFHFGLFLYKRKQLSLFKILYSMGFYALHKCGFYSIAQMQHTIFKNVFKGASKLNISRLANEFVSASFDQLLYHPAVERLKSAKMLGQRTVILSSSPDFLVQIFAKHFDVDAWDATEYVVDGNNRFSHISHMFLSDNKADYVEKVRQQTGIAKHKVTAYSDSILDLSFLKAAGTSVGVNPDRLLKAFCKENDWEVL